MAWQTIINLKLVYLRVLTQYQQQNNKKIITSFQIKLSFVRLFVLILLMEAIIIGSRSISQNHCFQRESQSNYKRHMQNIKLINSEKILNLQEMKNDVEHLEGLLQKSKSAAKLFRQRQEKVHLKNQNNHLIKKIWHLEPIVNTHNPDKYQYVSGSNWTHHLKKQAEIKDQNRRIGRKMLIQHHLEKVDFKQKLKAEIKDYIQLRNSIRKIKKSFDGKIKRTYSENKINVEKARNETERKIKKGKLNPQGQQQQQNQGNKEKKLVNN